MHYTVLKPFIFRGVSFNTGDLFDTDKMSCEPHKAKQLMNTRHIVPGYTGEKAPSEPQKPEKQPANQPEKGDEDNGNSEPDEDGAPDTPEDGDGEKEDGEEDAAPDEPEDGEDEEEQPKQQPQPQPQRTSRRRS